MPTNLLPVLRGYCGLFGAGRVARVMHFLLQGLAKMTRRPRKVPRHADRIEDGLGL